MAWKRGRRRVALGGTAAAIIIGTAVLLYFFFREHFAAALVGVVGLLLGAASLLVGIVPLFSAGPREPVPVVPPAPEVPATLGEQATKIDVHADRDAFVAARDINFGSDGSKYSEPDFPMIKRHRGGAAEADGEAGG
jgi:hypothetical protein